MAKLVTFPNDAPLEDMIEQLKKDGGIIVKDFASLEILKEIENGVEPAFQEDLSSKLAQMDAFKDQAPVDFYASNTIHIFRLVAKAPRALTWILQNPTYVGLMDAILSHDRPFRVGDKEVHCQTSWKLNVTSAMRIAPGADCQILHRDQTIHSVDAKEGSLYTSMLGCIIAGTDMTERNGATKVVPGSHIWDPKRNPTNEEAVSAEMTKGSALFFFGSAYHGGGKNSAKLGEPNSTRTVYGIFGVCDYYEAEENQCLATPVDIVRTLPQDVQGRLGWRKTTGGAGWHDLGHPNESWSGFKTAVGVGA